MPNGFTYPGTTGFGKAKMMITVSFSDDTLPAGTTVTVTEMGTGEKYAEFTYGNQPVTLDLPAHFHYQVTAPAKLHYYTPEPVEGVAKAKDVISVLLTYRPITRYGFRRTKAESDPEQRITYLFDAVGKTPFSMDFSSGTPVYGDWEAFVNEVACPVMLKYNGTEDYELDRDDQTKKADGEPSDISDLNYQGNAMVRFGGKWKWVRRYEDSDYEYVIFADAQYDSDYHAYAHTDAAGVVRDAFYYGMFKASSVGGKYRSLADQTIQSAIHYSNGIAPAQANGPGWDLVYKSAWDYISDLLILIAKNDNGQAVFGTGYCTGSDTHTKTGERKASGGFYGKSVNNDHVKVFWIEDYWGNIWEMMNGFIMTRNASSGKMYVKMTPPYNATASGYEVSETFGAESAGGGFTNASTCTDKTGFLPSKWSAGSGTTYFCDACYAPNNSNQYGYAYCSSDSVHTGGWAGPRAVNFSVAGGSNSPYHVREGTRISYIPDK